MPRINRTLNLPGMRIEKTEGLHNLHHVVSCRQTVSCPDCGGNDLRNKGYFTRRARHESVGRRSVTLTVKGRKYHCRSCGRYFREQFKGIQRYKRATEAFRKEVFYDHLVGVCQRDLGKQHKISTSTVERWFHDYYYLENQKIKSRMCPRILGIDEHSFSKNHQYATTFCDLHKRRVFDVVLGHSEADLRNFLESLQGRDRVRVVCIDLSNTYRSIVAKYFPNAKIVADRFHVIRLANQMFMKTWQSIDGKQKYNRGMLRIMRSKPENLSDKDKNKLAAYLDKEPAIAALYEFKQKLYQLFMHKKQTAKKCRLHIRKLFKYINMLKDSGFKHMKTLAKTLDSWKEEIARMWRFTKNNGITEGFHRKMKLIQRRAYGFRNFENYRLRVKILCG
ncbi:MAG: ISL3 family transposase [Micavibrio sp.]|nr:ISL3 family transposase [Micavibrio sp.]